MSVFGEELPLSFLYSAKSCPYDFCIRRKAALTFFVFGEEPPLRFLYSLKHRFGHAWKPCQILLCIFDVCFSFCSILVLHHSRDSTWDNKMRYYRSASNLSKVCFISSSIVAKALDEGFHHYDDFPYFLHIVPVTPWCQESHARAALVSRILAWVWG